VEFKALAATYGFLRGTLGDGLSFAIGILVAIVIGIFFYTLLETVSRDVLQHRFEHEESLNAPNSSRLFAEKHARHAFSRATDGRKSCI
jgi:hypothetical protein